MAAQSHQRNLKASFTDFMNPFEHRDKSPFFPLWKHSVKVVKSVEQSQATSFWAQLSLVSTMSNGNYWVRSRQDYNR